MADDKIVHRISLEGADDVANKLKKVGDISSDAFKKVQQTINDSSSHLAKYGESFAAIEGKTEEGRQGVEKLREAIHILHPVLDTAGLGIGNLGSFARVAGGGIGALAAAIVGSLLVGLAKIADESDKAKRRLDLLTGAGKGGGESQFEGLNKDAKELGTTLSTIAPLAESLFKFRQQNIAQNRNVIHPGGFAAGATEEAASRVQVFSGNQSYPGGAPSPETIKAATRAIVEAGRLDRSTPEESIAAGKEFFDAALGGNGLVTSGLLDKLPPALADAVTKALSGSGTGGTGQAFENISAVKKFIEQGGRVTGGQTLAGLARVEPELREQAAKIPLGVTEEFGRLEAATKSLAEAFSGDIGLAGGIEKLVKVINDAAQNADRFLHPRDYEPGGPKFIGPVSEGERKEYNKPDLLDLGKTLITGKSDQRFEDSNAVKVTKFLRDGPAALQQTPSQLLEYLGGASSQPRASSQQQQPFIQETNRGAGVSTTDQLTPTIQAGDAAITDAVKTGNEATTSILGNILNAIINFLNGGSKQQPLTEPSGNLGIRGRLGGFFRRLWNGGHVSGPGGPREDKVPAMLSDGEFVVNAEDTKRNRALLEHINAGHALGGMIRHFAEGGAAVRGNLSITYDPTSGGAYINGTLFPPGSPILDEPEIAAAIARSKADMGANTSSKASRHPFGDFTKEFGGGHATGGLIGRDPGTFASRIAAMGFAGIGYIDVPHLAGGGLPDFSTASFEAGSFASGGGTDFAHYGTLNLQTNFGSFPVITHEDTLRHMNTAAVEAAAFSTGSKPGWYGGSR